MYFKCVIPLIFIVWCDQGAVRGVGVVVPLRLWQHYAGRKNGYLSDRGARRGDVDVDLPVNPAGPAQGESPSLRQLLEDDSLRIVKGHGEAQNEIQRWLSP